jgi:hypothetical protein
MQSALNVGNTANPYASVDKQTIIGALKATGSRDPDVLHAKKVELYGWLKFARVLVIPLMLIGLVMSLMGIAGAVFGIPFLLLGYWLWRRVSRNMATIEAGYAEYISSLST